MEIESFFENQKQIIENELLKAKSNILIAVAWINFKEYGDIFEQILEKNVKLQIICSDNSTNQLYKTKIAY